MGGAALENQSINSGEDITLDIKDYSSI